MAKWLTQQVENLCLRTEGSNPSFPTVRFLVRAQPMKKYRASVLLFSVAVFFSLLHFYLGWNDFVLEANEAGTKATIQDWLWRYGKEEAEGFPSEMTALATELALFAGVFKLFKPYDEDTEFIKKMEQRIDSRFDRIEKHMGIKDE